MNTSKNIPVLFLLVALVVLSGCCRKTQVILLPDEDGTVGAVTVGNKQGSVNINKSGESTVVANALSAPKSPTQLSVEDVHKQYSELLAILPDQPEHILLYFLSGSTQLTDKSMELLLTVPRLVESKDSEHISVIGHTDRTGDEEYNLRLSTNRAQAITDMLIGKGVGKDFIATTSHGEENPLVKTEDNVAEIKNRRVEIIVR